MAPALTLLVQPIKIGIHEDLLAALSAEIKPTEVKRFLHDYVNCAAYLRALLLASPGSI